MRFDPGREVASTAATGPSHMEVAYRTEPESGGLAVGSYHTVVARPARDGGSALHGIWDNTAISGSARFGLLMMRAVGRPFFTRYYRQVFDQLAAGKL
ncbi:hypothetical protein [Nocardia cyriacigeorgica]|uniref:hypothetical protein n=1 Tax=Nocardia cyriacigeorgica TaxID=135487 RepID=UPI001893FD8B|nr:hypothetical protein [Nocardia cyriacigeorgica]MBF6438069.1 hypothetical protein [Nocardia cyriacigeorgica]